MGIAVYNPSSSALYSGANITGTGALYLLANSAEAQNVVASVVEKYIARPVIDSLGRMYASVSEVGQGLMTSFSGRLSYAATLFKPATSSPSSCYDRIMSEYPELSGSEKQVVKDVCDNQLTSIEIIGYISTPGIEAIAEALKENTVLTYLKTSSCGDGEGPLDDPTTAMTALMNALKINRTLKILDLSGCFLDSSAYEVLFENLPCTNLESLTLEAIEILTASELSSLARTLQENQFPLANISFTQAELDSSAVEQVASGIAGSGCVQALTILDMFKTYSEEALEAIFLAMSKSKALAHLEIGSMGSNWWNFNRSLILDSVRENTCLVEFKVAPLTDFPQDLFAAIEQIIAGRSPCTQDPKCKKPKDCPVFPPSGPDSGSAGTSSLATILGTTGGALVLVLLGIALGVRRCRSNDPASAPLMRPEREH